MHRAVGQACARFGRPWIGSVIEACNLAQAYSGWRSEDNRQYNDENDDRQDNHSRKNRQGRKRYRFATGFQDGDDIDFNENRLDNGMRRGRSKNHVDIDSEDWAEERFYEDRNYRSKAGHPRNQKHRPDTDWDEGEFFQDREYQANPQRMKNRSEMDWDEEEFFEDRDHNTKGGARHQKNHPEWEEEEFLEDRDYSEKRSTGSRKKNKGRMNWEENIEERRLHNARRNEARYSDSELDENSSDGEFDEDRDFDGRGRGRWPNRTSEKHWDENEGFNVRGEEDGSHEKGWGEDFNGSGGRDIETTYSENLVDEDRDPEDGDESDLDGEENEGIDPDGEHQHIRDQGDPHGDSESGPSKSHQDDERNFEEFDDEEDGGEAHELDRMLADIEDDDLANEEMLQENSPPGMAEFDDDVLEKLESVKENKEYQEERETPTKGVEENLRLKTQERKMEALTRALGTFYQPPLGAPYKAKRMATLTEDLDEKRKQMGHEHPVVIKLLLNLAHEMDDYKKYSSSEPLYRELLETRRKMWGKEHEMVATAMIALGNNAKAQDRTDEGDELLKDGLKMLIKCNPNICKTLIDVGDRLLDDKQPEKAESMTKAALIISRAKNPEIHVETADALRHLVQCVLNSNHFQDAEKYALEELEMRKKLDGEESPEVAVSIATVGYCHIGNLNYREADLEIREGLAMRRKLKGRLDVEVARMTHYLGISLLGLGLFHEAEDILKEAIGIYERLGYNEHLILPATMMSLSEAYMGQNKIKETHAIRRHAIGLYHKLGVHVTDES
ncbi:hypothetical protein BSKO_08883 [Bryopsis sp. KO-2023]|nr:hypothetical protein BSKO_08883 [Bryopsis sp. KO-2023]